MKTDCLLNWGPGRQPHPIALMHEPIDEKTGSNALQRLEHVQEECRKIDLEISASTASEVLERIKSGERVSFDWLLHQIDQIQKLMQKEMGGKVFLYIPRGRVRFFPLMNAPHLFGEKVSVAFPSASYDISEAGACLGLVRPTASVFHLMRVLEAGLSALGKVFGVSLEHTNWGHALDQIESKIRNMRMDPSWKAVSGYREQQEYYAQAASHLGILKDAWRNYTMHSHGECTLDEAEQIFDNVKSFMRKLAERLNEQQP